ncbi:MAG TPA: GDSL-type esterase/lipase family protein [Cellvibrionaceae bacterium]
MIKQLFFRRLFSQAFSCTALLIGLSFCGIACAEPSAQTTALGVLPVKRVQEFSWMSVADWERQHAEDVLVAQFDHVDVLFIGDSITSGWDTDIWTHTFAPLKAANFAIGGDHTGNVLWRLQHGAIGNLKPKLVVLLIGVNNFGHLNEAPAQVAQGVGAVVRQIQLAWPHSKILLNAILPYEADAKSPKRAQVKLANTLIAHLADGKAIIYKDYGQLFLDKSGNITADTMPDYLHPSAQAYRLWAQALLPDIQALLH